MDSRITNSNDYLQTVVMAFTTGGIADPSLYENKGQTTMKIFKNEENIMPLNKYDLYIGKSIYCCCGKDCGNTYEVITDIYKKDGEELFDIKDKNTGEVKSINVDFINEYSEY